MTEKKKRFIRTVSLLGWLLILFGGCTSVNDRINAAKTVQAQSLDGREFQAITRQVEIPIRVDRFRKTFNQLENEKLHVTIAHFQNLVEWALVLRYRTVTFAAELTEKKSHDVPVSGDDLERLSMGIKQHLALREEVMSLIYTYKGVALHAGDEPWLIESGVRVKATMLAMAASLVLYDNFAISVMAFQDNNFLRRLANRADKGFDIEPETLKKVLLSYHSPEKRLQVRNALEWLQGKRDWVTVTSRKDQDLAYLQELIDGSPSLQDIRDDDRMSDYAKYFGLFAHRSSDRFLKFSEGSMNELSKSFGNTVGLVELRKGKLYNKPEVEKELRDILKPLDVLLEKTPFRLTDKFIPGHFGHVAIWVGTEAELRAAGLWEHPLIMPHQNDIRAGKQVLEALRHGVVLSSLEHFLNIDDLAILRLKQADLSERQDMLIRSFRQLGKAYDFNFDVETPDKIVCSELIYAVYTHIAWPTEAMIGRATISPDNVAVMALEGKSFDLVSFYRDGIDVGATRYEAYEMAVTLKK